MLICLVLGTPLASPPPPHAAPHPTSHFLSRLQLLAPPPAVATARVSVLQTRAASSRLRVLLRLLPGCSTHTADLRQTRFLVSCGNLLPCHLLRSASPATTGFTPSPLICALLVSLPPPGTPRLPFLIGHLSSQPRMHHCLGHVIRATEPSLESVDGRVSSTLWA